MPGSGFAGRNTQRALLAAALYALYTEVRQRVLTNAERTGERIGPRWLGLLAWRMFSSFSDLVGVRLASEGGEGLSQLDPSKRYLIVWHPHGFLAWSPMFIVSRMAIIGHPHGREWFAMVASALFRLPVISEVLMLANGRRVSKDVVESLCGQGKSIAIQPGGVREQIWTQHDQEKAVFPANLGFIRMAIKYGMDLLPVYLFNENQMFQRVKGFDGFSEWMYKQTGFGLPAVTGKFGLPMAGLLPRATEVHVRWGVPIAVGEKEDNPSEERVEELFAKYIEGLLLIFERHAKECLTPEVAARGLKVIRLDGKPIPPVSPAAADALATSAPPSAPAIRSRL